jgi:hypothetical protein
MKQSVLLALLGYISGADAVQIEQEQEPLSISQINKDIKKSGKCEYSLIRLQKQSALPMPVKANSKFKDYTFAADHTTLFWDAAKNGKK